MTAADLEAEADQTFTGRQFRALLDVLRIRPDEVVSVCHQGPDGKFTAETCLADTAADRAAAHADTADVWFGVAPVKRLLPADRRGSAADVARLPALFTDLDVKPGGLPDNDAMFAVQRVLEHVLGVSAPVLVHSGHGMHPYWPILDGDNIGRARKLLARFGLLVEMVAQDHGGHVDNVHELARVLRVPGTQNRKEPASPVDIGLVDRRGDYGDDILTLNRIEEALDTYGVPTVEQADIDAPVVSAPTGWTPGAGGCGYTAAMVNAWATDKPTARGRHPWLTYRATRLWCAYRAGCFTEAGFRDAKRTLEARFLEIIADPTIDKPRQPNRNEFAGAMAHGLAVTSKKTDAAVWDELGGEPHAHALREWQPAGEQSTGTDVGDDHDPHNDRRLGTRLTRSELANLPPVEPLIDGLLSRRAAVVLVGPWGVGKTFLSLSIACSVATGTNWLGHDTHRTKTMYVVGEGAYGLDPRVTAWEKAWQVKVTGDDLVFYAKPDSLTAPATWQAITEEAQREQVGLVVLDTLSSLAPDADEVKDAPRITRRLSDLAVDIDGTGLLVHHPGWSDNTRTRGGYQLEGNVDEVLLMSGMGEGSPLVTVKRKKVKDGPAGETLWLRRVDMHGSCVIEHARQEDAAVPVRERILHILTDVGEEGATGPQLLLELGIPAEKRSTLTKQLRVMVAADEVEQSGPRGRSRYRLSRLDRSPRGDESPRRGDHE